MTRRLLAALLLFAAGTARADLPCTTDGAPAPCPAPSPRAVDQTITLPTTSAASVGGASAGLVNPAGLAYTGGLEFNYLHQRSVFNDRVGDGTYLAWDPGGVAVGFSLEWIRFGPGSGPGFRRTSLSLALGDDTLSIGGAYHSYGASDSPLYNNLNSWDVGIQARPFRFLSAGFAVLDVDGPSAAGVSLPQRYDVGLGLRPFGERLTLTADLWVDGKGGFDEAALLYNAQWRIVDGLTVMAGLTHYFNEGQLAGTVGLAIDGDYLGVFTTAGADSGVNQVDSLVGLRISSARHPSVHSAPEFAVLDLNELLSPPSGGLLSVVFGEHHVDPYLSTLGLLRKAKGDTQIQGVVLKFGSLQGSLGGAHVEELRQAVGALRRAGKPVIALLSDADDGDLFLASACDRIYVVPEATLLINGLDWSTIFLGETLGRIGVKVDVARVGAFKNAPDQLTRADMSPEQREAEEAFLKTAYGAYQLAVTTGRKLDAAKFDQSLSKGILTPQQAKDFGLIDGIAYPDELNQLASEALGRRATTIADYPERENFPDRWGNFPQVALVRIAGTINEGKSSGGLGGEIAGSDSIIRAIEAARDEDSIKAIVVRVDSPGGSGNASNLIERAMEKARERKPVVVSMGNTAASGGYYVAVGGDAIWAEPTTLTGSIGVFVLKPDFSGLMQKLSVHETTLKKGERADIFSFTKGWSPEEQAAMQGYADAFYDRFITLVAGRRKLAKDAVDKVARGRIWSGADAKQLGLVDQLGSLDDALRDAKQRAGLDPDERVELRYYGESASRWPKDLLQAQTQDDVRGLIQALGLEATTQEIGNALLLARMPGTIAALPFSYTLH